MSEGGLLGIIQARMGSTHLPGKVLRPLSGKPVLQWVIERASRIPELEKVVVATSVQPRDDAIVDFANKCGVACVRGDEEDVLSRFMTVLEQYPAPAVVRMTADNPCIDPAVASQVIGWFRGIGVDYAALGGYFPNGLDIEVVRTEALKRANELCCDIELREHVTAPIYNNPKAFSLLYVFWPEDHREMRWTVDTRWDFDFLERLFGALEGFGLLDRFTWRDLLDMYERFPEFWRLQPRTVRNVGKFKRVSY